MMSCTAAVLLACLVGGPADEKPDFAKELGAAKEKFAESTRAGGNAMATLNVANRQRRSELQALVAKADSIAPEKLTAADHEALAEAQSMLGASEKAAAHAAAAVKSDPKNVNAQELLVRNLANSGKAAEAEAAFKAAPPFPERTKNTLTLMMAQSYARADDLRSSSRLHIAYLDAIRPGALKEVRESQMYARSCGTYVRAMGPTRRQEALKRVEGDVDAFAKVAATKPEWGQPLTDLRMLQVGLLMENGDKTRSLEILTSEKKNSESDPKPASAIARRLAVIVAQMEHGDDASAKEALADYTGFANEMIKRHDAGAATAALRGFNTIASNNMYDRPQLSQEAMTAGKSAAEAVKAKGAADNSAVTQIEAILTRMEPTLRTSLARAALIGKPAKPWNAEAWVNGAALSPDSLKGKVVLIDFWAVWCGPCIMTFPHLREWNEKFEKNGLVILGFTQYYKYGWDETAGRGVSSPGISKVEERAATEKFAKHHKLSHRLAYFPDPSVSKAYEVSGIPQAVLIDRNGVVRMIRVGAGDKNAHDLEKMIQKLLAESPAPATGG